MLTPFDSLDALATHQSSVLSRRPPSLDATHAREAQDRARVLAAHLSTAAHALLLSAMAMSSTASDLLISTALLLVFGSILGATRDWRANLDVVRRLLELRGGPATVLAETRAAMGRGELDGSALMRLRAMLECVVLSPLSRCARTLTRNWLARAQVPGHVGHRRLPRNREHADYDRALLELVVSPAPPRRRSGSTH